jgi:hypothetical protein
MNIYARALMWTHPYTSTQFSVNYFQIVELKIDEVIMISTFKYTLLNTERKQKVIMTHVKSRILTQVVSYAHSVIALKF